MARDCITQLALEGEEFPKPVVAWFDTPHSSSDGESRGVVNAVSHHSDHGTLALQALDDLDVLLRQAFGTIVHAELARQSTGDPLVVAGEEQSPPAPESPEVTQGFRA